MKIYLAPMAGVTDSAFRILVRKVSDYSELMFSEMVSSTGIHYKSQKTYEMLDFTDEELPIAVQLFGSNPEFVAEAAEYISQLDNVSAIDFNLGCPAPKIVKNGEGSALMKNPKLTEELIKALRHSTNLPVSVKMRIGFDSEHINAVEIAKIAETAGVNSITVHGRTREQYYSGKADWSIIADVKQAVSIPVIGNGDILDAKDVIAMHEQTGCDGFMIGRGAQGNPWIFHQILHYFETGELIGKPPMEEMVGTMLRHAKLQIEYKGEYLGIREMRKHAAWYTAGYKGASRLRGQINDVESYEDLEALFKSYLNQF